MKPQDFTATYGPLASDISQATGMDPSVVLGVIGQETGFGEHISGNNVFGISPGGKVAAYPSVSDAAQAFVGLMNSQRYAGVKDAGSPDAQAQALVRGGYNTVDTGYAGKVARIAAQTRQTGDGAPSVEDLQAKLKALQGAPQPQQEQVPSVEDLQAKLKGLNLGPPEPDKPAPGTPAYAAEHPSPEASSVSVPPNGGILPPPPVTAPDFVGDVWRGLKQGYGTANPLMTPELQRVLEDRGDPGNAAANLLTAGGAILRGGSALYRGGQAAVADLLGGGQLGRDIVSIPDAFAGSPNMLAAPAGEPAASSLPLRGMPPRNVLAPERAPPTIEGTATEIPAGMAQPQAAGAEATSEPIPPKTKGQAARDLQTSVQQTAEDRAGPQMEDHNEYVPGVERPLAARRFTAQNSLDDKVLRAKDPEYRTQVERIEKNNNDIMVDLLRKDAGDDISLEQAHTDREAVSPGGLHVFDNQKPVDAQPLVDEIDSTLKGEAGKRDAVKRTLRAVRDSLYDADGNLETMPSQLYGARQNITDMLKKGVKGVGQEADDVRASKAILTGLLDKIDPVISQGAPKFKDEYLPKFTEASQPINQQEFLQRYQTGSRKLTGGDGYLQFIRVQKMLDDIYQGRKAPGVNPAKSLTQEQIDHIIAVRNELAANSLRDRLGNVKGSDTFQQLNAKLGTPDTPLRAGIKGAGMLSTHAALLHSPAAGVGNALLGGYQMVVKPALKAAQEQKVRAAIAARKAELLQTNRGMKEAP